MSTDLDAELLHELATYISWQKIVTSSIADIVTSYS